MLSDNFTDKALEIVFWARQVTRAYRWPAHFLRANSAITSNRIYLKLKKGKTKLLLIHRLLRKNAFSLVFSRYS